jgi:hypothetical protein
MEYHVNCQGLTAPEIPVCKKDGTSNAGRGVAGALRDTPTQANEVLQPDLSTLKRPSSG